MRENFVLQGLQHWVFSFCICFFLFSTSQHCLLASIILRSDYLSFVLLFPCVEYVFYQTVFLYFPFFLVFCQSDCDLLWCILYFFCLGFAELLGSLSQVCFIRFGDFSATNISSLSIFPALSLSFPGTAIM